MNTIHRLYRSKSDIENLSKLRTSIPVGQDSTNYKGVVVNKPWGYEYLIFENQFVAIWVLYLKHNYKTSMHCHPTKKTSLMVLSGSVECSGLEGWYDRSAGQGLMIEEAVFHSTLATDPNGAFIMEIETPPNKKDLVRLNDAYGRKLQGYEGSSEITRDTSRYQYFDFHEEKKKRVTSQVIQQCHVGLHTSKNPANVSTLFKQTNHAIVSLLQGRLHARDGSDILTVGESTEISTLTKQSQIYGFGDIMYLTLGYQ